MENYTKTGLLLIMIGIVIGIISNISLFLISFLTNDDISGILTLVLVGLIAGVGGLLILIGAILMIIGRKEYGEKHSRYVIYAIIIFIVSIGISVVFSVIVAMIGYISADPTTINITFFQITIAALLGGLAYIFLLYELEDKNGRTVLFAAYITSIIISIAVAVYNMGIYEELLGSAAFEEKTFTEIMNYVSNISKTSIYSVISSVLLLIAVFIPYRRITSGELVPVSPASDSLSKDKSSRRCPNCGRAIPFDANICPYCSKKFEDYL